MVPLAIGIIGAGEITRRAHLPVLANIPGVKMAWIHDQRPERAQALAAAYGLNALSSVRPDDMPACDVALLAIPVEARGEYLQHFAHRGTAVFCEKPFALSAAQHASITAQFAPYALGCGYMRRLYRSALLLRRIVADGIFGPLVGIEVSEGGRSKGSGVDSSFLDDPRFGAARGVLVDLGSHTIDLALYVSGAAAFEVLSCTKVMDGTVDRKVSAHVQLSGTPAKASPPIDLQYGVSWLDRQSNRIRLTFAHTSVWSDLAVSASVYVGNPDATRDAIALNAPSIRAATYNQAFFLEWMNFLESLRARRESLVSARSALLTTSLIERLLAGESHDA